jgi:hypothetical protein
MNLILVPMGWIRTPDTPPKTKDNRKAILHPPHGSRKSHRSAWAAQTLQCDAAVFFPRGYFAESPRVWYDYWVAPLTGSLLRETKPRKEVVFR